MSTHDRATLHEQPPAALGPAASQDEYQLPVAGFQGTPEEVERQWFLNCYRGRGDSMLQLTARALLMGAGLGAVLSVTNIYIGLKAGWGFGVAITACILSYAIWTTLYKLRIARTPMTILENNCMQTAASAAGYSTGGTLISAFAAYMMLHNAMLPMWQLLAWVFLLAILGVTMAVPMKRQMINIEQLRFPSGVAAAETLKALHSRGGGGLRSARALGLTGLLAAAIKFWSEGLTLISDKLHAFQLGTWVQKFNQLPFMEPWAGRTVALSSEFMFIAAGAITGARVCTSMMLGAVTCWMVFVPILQSTVDPRTGLPFIAAQGGFRECVQWTLWGGTACMVTSGLLAFALQWRSAVRAFRGLARMFGRKAAGDDPLQAAMDAIETPGAWFVGGQLFALVGLAWLGHVTFQIPVWQCVLAVVLSFALALVACRVTGETDTTPIGAMGKVTQLAFGAIAPAKVFGPAQAMTINLMAANITAGSAGSAAALLTDLKSGYLLGAHPRKQFLAQFSGVFLGTIVTVLVFMTLVPTPAALGTAQFPAPAAQAWKAVAEAMADIARLHPVKIWSIVIGGLVGLILPLLSRAMPRYSGYVPSAAGLGLAWTFPWYYAFYFFIGGLIAWYLEKRKPRLHEDYTFTVASGWIAGESLMGAGLIVGENGPAILRQLFGRPAGPPG